MDDSGALSDDEFPAAKTQLLAREPLERKENGMASTGSVQASALHRLLDAAVTGDGDAMADLVTTDVTGWSPNLFVTSRDQLLAGLERRDDTRLLPGADLRVLPCRRPILADRP
jgi:hypothetical protein